MERITRKPFQGITNIVRFNWHYYVIAFTVIIFLLFARNYLAPAFRVVALVVLLLAIISIIISLFVSWYIYDHSDLYSLQWLNNLSIGSGKQLVNINAGFDETSALLMQKYPGTHLVVFDFYDPVKHTEISIERARKAYPPYPGTKTISTGNIPLEVNSIDYIFLVLAAHEIRKDEERIEFFRQLGMALKTGGKIIVTEHQRDLNNFIAYNIGFLHFFSPATWKHTFSRAGLSIETWFKLTPFITTFVLEKNGTIA
jgi:SAM-dependent methyltransferase